MARARNIKPSFFKNDELAEIDPLGRLLFIGLWSLCDFKGELEWREKRVKAEILPYDNCDILELAINLDKSGFIRYYSSQGKMYLNIPNFIKHQNPHVNERKKGSEIPEYSNESRQAVELKGLVINRDKSGLVPECSESDRADSCSLNPEPFILNPEPCSLKADIKPIVASAPVEQKKRVNFVAPTANDVYQYMLARNVNDMAEANSFVDFYESKGWLVGKNKMKSWQASVRNWLKNYKPAQSPNQPESTGWSNGMFDDNYLEG